MRHATLRPVLLAAALLAGGAAAQPDPRDALARLNALGQALAAQKCPRPVEVKTSFVRNPSQREVADEMQSIDCRSFRVAIYRSLSATPPRESPMSVVLEGAHPLAVDPWAVGASAQAVRAGLGAPAREFGESLVYSLDPRRDGRDTLTFEVRGGVVRALNWSWDVD